MATSAGNPAVDCNHLLMVFIALQWQKYLRNQRA